MFYYYVYYFINFVNFVAFKVNLNVICTCMYACAFAQEKRNLDDKVSHAIMLYPFLVDKILYVANFCSFIERR